jgi:glycosyltransferase involved in cell wall biosynthesis
METPLISIITPAYNAEKTIQRTIQSVLNQTYTNFEFLIINDGSQDRTLEIAQSFKDIRIKIFSHPNRGHSATRNRGISAATGEYIAFLDADDCWTSDKLAAQLNALQTHPQAAVAYSWSDFVDETDRRLHRGCYTKANGDVYPKLLNANFIENGSNPLIRRSALARVGNFDESLTTASDWDLWLRLAAHYQFVCVPMAQVLYRVSPTSVSANIRAAEVSCLRILDTHFAQAAAHLQHLKPHSLGNLYLYLTLRALEASPSRWSSLGAMRYLIQAMRHDPSLPRRRTHLTWIALLKLGLSVLLTPTGMRQQLSRMKGRQASMG